MIDLNELIASANNLEPLPQSVMRLVELVSQADVDIAEIQQVFSYDAALTAKLLRQANSAASSSRYPIGTVSAAVVRLGLGAVLALAISVCVQKKMEESVPEYGLSDGDLWRHSQATRLAVETMKKHCAVTIPAEAQTAALLHDLGKNVMAKFLNTEIISDLHEFNTADITITLEAENEVLSVHHGELGGLIAQSWNLPDSIVRGIQYHHTPDECTHEDNIICHVVCMADWIAKAVACKQNKNEFTLEMPASSTLLGLSTHDTDLIIDTVLEISANL